MRKELTSADHKHLEHCLELATEALRAGDQPFGSILVNEDDEVIAKSRNRVNDLHPLAHPEYELALWAATNLSEEERKKTTMYTTGEHCPMCSAAHGWVGLGAIVYLSSGKQLTEWLAEMEVPEGPVRLLPVEDIIREVEVRGPAEGEMVEKIRLLHEEYYHLK